MDSTTQQEIQRWSTLAEGQFFERKSCWDRSGSHPRHCRATDIARDIAETLSAMANADGGELVIGMDNDGKVTGVPHPEDKIRLLMGVPKDRNFVIPPLPSRSREVLTSDGIRLLHFEVDWSPDVHQLADSRYLLRVDDRNSPFAADRIAALKAAKAQGLFERSYPTSARLDDLDLSLLSSELGRLWPGLSSREILRRYGLVADRNGHSVPTMAALLLFGKEPERWHPRCGIDFVRWEGTERKHGAELNISKRIRIEAPLATLIRQARESIQPFIRERQQLHDLFFKERLEYPTFAWQEAIVNAVAHRDYSLQGASIEIWMYEDRMEIRSPGPPPAPVSVEALNRGERIHFSRNPLLVRVLADLTYMRELGEGIPRIFSEMHRAGYYPPRFELVGGFVFQVTLRNAPVYDQSTLDWLEAFRNVNLTGDQKRMLAYAHAHGNRFTSREFQRVIGIDIYAASSAIKDMIRKGVLRSTGKGSRLYEVHEPLEVSDEMPLELRRVLKLLHRKGHLKNEDLQKALGVSRITAWRLLTNWIKEEWITPKGAKRGRGRLYVQGERLMFHPQTRSNPPETET